jgi:hypothetical protein
MTPEEELKRLNRLIRQYETIYRTATDGEQRERVGKELKQLQSYRDKILAVNVIDGKELEEPAEGSEELEDFPILERLVAEAERREAEKSSSKRNRDSATLTPSQRAVFYISLYKEYFAREFIPFLTETRLKLDFKFSMERDSFYRRFQDLERKIADYQDEYKRLSSGIFTKDMELEVRKRAFKLERILEADASKFFRAVKRFCTELVEDARTDGVKCLNGDSQISFDKIEGKRLLAGETVVRALEELGVLAQEAIEYLNVPELESQENERADRY